jgi:hypothetical protein
VEVTDEIETFALILTSNPTIATSHPVIVVPMLLP